MRNPRRSGLDIVRSMSILLIEEDGFFAEGVKRAFAAQGMDVIHLTNVLEAVESIAKHLPDAVLFDLRLSSLNGFELLGLLKADKRTKRIPLMIWSHLASREDIQRCFDLGASEYFLKGQHQPREVATALARRFAETEENGFTLPEWVAVVAVFGLALAFAWVQFQRALDIRRDDGQMQSIRAAVSAIVTAGQERTLLVQCPASSEAKRTALAGCKLCKESECLNQLPVPWTNEPTYERVALGAETLCTPTSVGSCRVTVEADGDAPVSAEAFKLRFFLARDRDGLAGGKTHTINAHGLVE